MFPTTKKLQQAQTKKEQYRLVTYCRKRDKRDSMKVQFFRTTRVTVVNNQMSIV